MSVWLGTKWGGAGGSIVQVVHTRSAAKPENLQRAMKIRPIVYFEICAINFYWDTNNVLSRIMNNVRSCMYHWKKLKNSSRGRKIRENWGKNTSMVSENVPMPLVTCKYFLLKHQCRGTCTVFLVALRLSSNRGSRAVTSCISTSSGRATNWGRSIFEHVTVRLTSHFTCCDVTMSRES